MLVPLDASSKYTFQECIETLGWIKPDLLSYLCVLNSGV